MISENQWTCFTDGGREPTKLDCVEWAIELERLGAGELLITSIDNDGTRKGYDISLIEAIDAAVSIPVVASGGFGQPNDILQLLERTNCSAAAVADFLHMGRGSLIEIKQALKCAGYELRSAS